MITDGDDDPAQRIQFGFELCLSRTPQPQELKTLTKALEDRLEYFRANPEEASKLLAIGESAIAEQIDHTELAAYATVARIILNLSEFITKG